MFIIANVTLQADKNKSQFFVIRHAISFSFSIKSKNAVIQKGICTGVTKLCTGTFGLLVHLVLSISDWRVLAVVFFT